MATVAFSCHGRLSWAALCLMASVVWDAADGFLARRWQVSSEFGAQLDSLADMTSFGVGAGALVYGWFGQSLPPEAVIPLAGWFGLTASWRLARFNVGPKLVGEFYGLPTTAVATLVAVTYLTGPQLAGQWFGAPLAALLAGLMISPLPYPKFTRVGELPRWLFGILPVCGWLHLSWTVWTCSILYLLTGPWIWLRRRRAEMAAVPGVAVN